MLIIWGDQAALAPARVQWPSTMQVPVIVDFHMKAILDLPGQAPRSFGTPHRGLLWVGPLLLTRLKDQRTTSLSQGCRMYMYFLKTLVISQFTCELP